MIRLFVVADIRLYRDGLAAHLSRHPDIEVVGTAGDRSAALEAVARLTPHVVLIDLAAAESLETMQDIRDAMPAVRVVALAVPEVERTVIACAEAGIAGYVPRDGSLEDMERAVLFAARGEVLVSPRMAASLMRRVSTLASALRRPTAPAAQLTAREREIARCLDLGLSNKQIAARLGIEVATVKNHVHSVLEKLKVSRRADVARLLHTHHALDVGGDLSP